MHGLETVLGLKMSKSFELSDFDSVSFISDSKPESKQNKTDSTQNFKELKAKVWIKSKAEPENTEDFPITDFGDPGKLREKRKDSEIISHTKDIKLQKIQMRLERTNKTRKIMPT